MTAKEIANGVYDPDSFDRRFMSATNVSAAADVLLEWKTAAEKEILRQGYVIDILKDEVVRLRGLLNGS